MARSMAACASGSTYSPSGNHSRPEAKETSQRRNRKSPPSHDCHAPGIPGITCVFLAFIECNESVARTQVFCQKEFNSWQRKLSEQLLIGDRYIRSSDS